MTHMPVKHMPVAPWSCLLRQSTICVMSIDAALGKAIRHHRTLAKIRQEDLPIDQGNLSKIERGIQSLSMDKLVELATAMRTTPSAIWATAEGYVRPAKPGVSEALAAAGERSEYQARLAGFVEAVIATTPDAAPALADFLRKSLAVTPRQDRKVLSALIVRVELPRARKRPKSAAPRARAPA